MSDASVHPESFWFDDDSDDWFCGSCRSTNWPVEVLCRCGSMAPPRHDKDTPSSGDNELLPDLHSLLHPADEHDIPEDEQRD